MKKLLALCLVLTLLVGCGAKQSPVPTEAPQTMPTEIASSEPIAIKKDGEFGLSYMVGYGFHPYNCKATINRAIFSLVYESLFTVSSQFRAEPVLCESFKVADEGKTFHVRLLSGLRFSDGTPVDGEDVKASIYAAMKSDLYAERLEHIDSIYVQEDGSISFYLDTAYENFALMLDVPILKQETLEQDTPIGTGAYKFQGQLLLQNPHWWGGVHGVLNVERIELSAAHAANDLRSHFEFGGTDLIYCDPNSTANVSYRCDYEVWEAPTTVMHYLGFNLYSGWFIEESLRSAVTYAIDRDAFANEIYGGFAQPTPLPCSPSSGLYDVQLAEEYDYAPGKFQAAVHNSGVLTSGVYDGYTGTFLVCMDDPTRVELAERICEVLNEAGIRLTVNALERNAYEDALARSQFDIYLGEVRLTANFDLSEFFMKYGNLQYGSIANTGLVTLCTEAIANSGSYSEFCSQLLNTAPICPVAFKSHAIYVTRGMISSNTPGVDLVFHDAATARSLSDADKTYEVTE